MMVSLSSSLAGAQTIQNNVFWKDTDGNPIFSQGGGAIQVGDTWYWYGAKYSGAVTYYNNPTQKVDGTGFLAVTCYSSKDLAHWKFEGDVFTGRFGWFGRLGVVYHAATKKYVLNAQAGGTNQVLFATSDSPTGKFTQYGSLQTPPGVANGGTGDQTVFQDDDGKAYIICSSRNGRSNWYVIPLRESDYLGMEQAVRIGGGEGREGNCMFKYRGRYYFVSSLLYGWNTSPAYYISATNILGPYGAEKVMVNSEKDYCHVTQTGFFITVKGAEDTTVIFAGDRWAGFAGNGIGFNQWTPVSFEGTDAVFNSLSQWSIDAVKGTWKVGPGNNYILNPAFEADRVSVGTVRGWTGGGNASGSHISGRFCLSPSGSGAYQDIPEIPNGTYTLTGYIQGACRLSASNFGGAERSATGQGSGWTKVTVPGIAISNGKARVGVQSSGGSCRADNLSLINDSYVVALAPRVSVSEPVSGSRIHSGKAVRRNGASLSIYELTGRQVPIFQSLSSLRN
jgi:hypothetical protein